MITRSENISVSFRCRPICYNSSRLVRECRFELDICYDDVWEFALCCIVRCRGIRCCSLWWIFVNFLSVASNPSGDEKGQRKSDDVIFLNADELSKSHKTLLILPASSRWNFSAGKRGFRCVVNIISQASCCFRLLCRKIRWSGS